MLSCDASCTTVVSTDAAVPPGYSAKHAHVLLTHQCTMLGAAAKVGLEEGLDAQDE